MDICTRPIRNYHLIDSDTYASLLGRQNVTYSNWKQLAYSERWLHDQQETIV